MNKRNLKGSLILLLASVIWGVAFVAQDMAKKVGVEPFTLNALRSYVGCFALIVVSAVISKKKKESFIPKTKADKKRLVLTGVACGVLLCIAANFQQFGIQAYSDGEAASARAGFLTAMYILFVPILGIFLKKFPGVNLWAGVLLAVAGLYFLCFSGGMSGSGEGDGIMLICAVAFAMHILCIDKFGGAVDGVKLSAIQFFTTAVLSTILMFIFEEPKMDEIIAAALPILFLGIMSSGVAYTLQIIGQQYCDNPTLASISMSFESVFAAIGGVLFNSEILESREWLGCAIMFAAIIVAQLPSPFKKKITA